MKRVGIVILNYNNSDYTIKCVKSIINIETYPDFQIVVVDNQSPGEGQIELLKTGLPGSVHLIINIENTGYAAGNNVGARYLRETESCDYIFIINNDSIYQEPLLHSLVGNLSEDENMFAVSPFVSPEKDKTADQLQVTQVRRILPLWESIICQSMLLSRTPWGKSIQYRYLYKDLLPYKKRLYKVDSINGAAFLIAADLLEKIGYLDEQTFLFAEELILGMQVKKAGMYCGLNCGIGVFHHQGASTMLTSKSLPFRMFKFELDSFGLLYKKYYRANKLVIFTFKFLRYFEFGLKKVYLWLK